MLNNQAVSSSSPWSALGRSKPFLAGVIVILALGVYIPATSGGFLWDDDPLVVNNDNLKSLQGLAWIWQCDWSGAKSVPSYYPVTWTSFWVEWHLWGRHAAGYHVTNILLHAANAVLIWLVLARLRIRWAWLAGALFAVHPINVASVAWIAERTNTLSMLFYLLALLGYLRYDEEGGWRRYILALGMFLLAMLSKTSVAMLPVVLLLIAWWRRDKVTRRDWAAAAPFFALAITLSIIGILYQTYAVIQEAPIRSPKENFFFRLAIAGIAPWFYLLKTVVPDSLAAVYPRWDLDPKNILSYLPGLALMGAMALMWRFRRHCKGALMATAYFVVTLFPVLGFFTISYNLYSFVADQWLYVPIVGLLALAAGGAEFLAHRRSSRTLAARAMAAVVVIVLCILTWRLSGTYASSAALWKDNIAKYPDQFLPYYNLGRILEDEGLDDEALEDYQKSLHLKPDFDKAYLSIGTILAKRNNYPQATLCFEKAMQLYPRSVTARMNLSAMLHLAGRNEEALYQLQQILRINDHNASVYINLARVSAHMGRLDEAIAYARRAVEIAPMDLNARMALATYLSQKGLATEAIAECRQAVKLDPDNAAAHSLLGLELRAVGRNDEAADEFRQVIQKQPSDAEAYNNLATTMVSRGDLAGALENFSHALALQPDNPDIEINLAFVLSSLNRPREAIELYRKALKVRPDWPPALSNLAWILANHPDASVHDPSQAVELAKRACDVTGNSQPGLLETLAIAYAASGQYDQAIKTATRAMELAKGAGDAARATTLAQRIEVWSAKRPGAR
ncbi:MAG: tetratricopeptide repeat protein [Phycisphaerae bacterium]|jgi:tetratricopeptide (TPR) repeat protein